MLPQKPPRDTLPLFRGLSCVGCSLQQKGIGFSHPDGTGINKILLLGEALGKQEAATGKPFVGQAGWGLNRTLGRSSLNRDDFAIWNVIACKPPGNWLEGSPWQKTATNHCRQYLETVVRHYNPDVIVPMGNVALKSVVGTTGILDRHAPKRGYIYEVDIGDRLRLCVPTMHPAFLLRGQTNLVGVQLWDIQRAVAVQQEGFTRAPENYILGPTQHDVQNFLNSAQAALSTDSWMAADIETPHSSRKAEEEYDKVDDRDILCISFAIEGGYAITIPWRKKFLLLIEKLLCLPGQCNSKLVFWNEAFDVPRIKAEGISLAENNLVDAMVMWHYLQSDVPKSLGFVAPFYTDLPEWKSLGQSQPQRYSCMDSDATVQCAHGIRDALIVEKRYRVFDRHHIQLNPILINTAQHGLLVDDEARKNFSKKLEVDSVRLDKELQALVPDKVAPIETRKVLKQKVSCWRCQGSRYDPDMEVLKKYGIKLKQLREGSVGLSSDVLKEVYQVSTIAETLCAECGGTGSKNWNVKPVDKWKAEGLKEGAHVQCEGYTATKVDDVWVWQKAKPFLPNAPKQVLAYIQNMGHPIPRVKGKATTDDHALTTLSKRYKGNKFYPLVLQSRRNRKLRSQYIEGYKPDPDGRLRGEYTQNPSTLRLSMRSPNLQNVPARSALAKEYRKMFVAAPGHRLVEIDYAAIEAVLTGWYAEDQDFILAAQLGIHAVLASHVLAKKGVLAAPIDLEGSEKENRDIVRLIKQEYPQAYNDCKHVVHGSNYGVTAFKIKQDFPDSFPTVADAQNLQNMYFDTIAKKVRAWQHKVIETANRKFYLDNVFGYRHFFWEPVTPRGAWGPDAKEALAFLPQSTAAGIIKEAMLEIAQTTYYAKAMSLQVHDSLLFEVPKDQDFCYRVAWLAMKMSQPIPELNGLTIGVEVKVGSNWGEMSVWDGN